MESSDESLADEYGDPQPFDRPLPESVDWIVGVLLALGGLALTVGGTALAFVVDRALLEAGVQSGEITVVAFRRELTEAQMLEFTLEIVNWTGIGLLATGVGLVLFAIGFVAKRHRTHKRTADGESAGSFWAYAIYGAVTTAILSFIPVSPVFGGGLAGYLGRYETGGSVGIGAASGFLATAPVVSLLAFVTGGLFSGLAAVGETGLGIVLVSAMALTMLFLAAYGAGLGAIGGFAGGWIAKSQA